MQINDWCWLLLAAKRKLQTQPRRALSAEALLASGAWMQRKGRLVNARRLNAHQGLQQVQRAQQRQLLQAKSIRSPIMTNCFLRTPESTDPILNLGFGEDVDGWYGSSQRSRNQNSTGPNSRSSSSQSRPQVLKGAGVLANFTRAWPWVRSEPSDSCRSECLVLTRADYSLLFPGFARRITLPSSALRRNGVATLPAADSMWMSEPAHLHVHCALLQPARERRKRLWGDNSACASTMKYGQYRISAEEELRTPTSESRAFNDFCSCCTTCAHQIGKHWSNKKTSAVSLFGFSTCRRAVSSAAVAAGMPESRSWSSAKDLAHSFVQVRGTWSQDPWDPWDLWDPWAAEDLDQAKVGAATGRSLAKLWLRQQRQGMAAASPAWGSAIRSWSLHNLSMLRPQVQPCIFLLLEYPKIPRAAP